MTNSIFVPNEIWCHVQEDSLITEKTVVRLVYTYQPKFKIILQNIVFEFFSAVANINDIH